MAKVFKSNTLSLVVLLSLTAFSCSLPLFSKTGSGGATNLTPSDKNFKPKPAKLSGVLDLHESCQPKFYQIKLTGLFEGANTQVESQSDQSGRFSLVAPPGQYLMQVVGDGCGAKQTVELEENTEHMVSIVVNESQAQERSTSQNGGRLPASVLIEPKR